MMEIHTSGFMSIFMIITIITTPIILAFTIPARRPQTHLFFEFSQDLALSTPCLTMDDYFNRSGTDHDLVRIIIGFSKAGVEISGLISTAPLQKLLGYSESQINGSGDRQKKLDVLSNEIILSMLTQISCIQSIASEENPSIICLRDPTTESNQEEYFVAFDPLDGSSNIDCSVPTGTIFAVYKTVKGVMPTADCYIGRQIIAAGYVLYSSATEFVFTTGNGAVGFTLNRLDGIWYLSRSKIECPTRGVYYSLNEARSSDWPAGLRRYINDIKDGKSESGKRYSSRYICSLVADVHRTLLYGGWAGNPRNHLRLLYEAAPLAFILEQAGGRGSDGKVNLLDVVPEHIHHRLPVFLGSRLDIDELESYGNVQQLDGVKYEA